MKVILGVIAAAVVVSACGKDEKKKGNSTYANLAVANSTNLHLTTAENKFTPTLLEMKLIDVRVLQELDTTKHPAPIIWYNPECGTATSSETEVDGKTYEYTQSPGCDITKITKYFDFARTSTEVNAELNSQPNKVYPAAYKYVTVTWCAGDIPSDNVRFQASGMSAPHAISSGSCGTISAEAVPPLTIAEGESVTISLNYSIADSVSSEGSSGCWTSGSVKRCLTLPTMTPTITKN